MPETAGGTGGIARAEIKRAPRRVRRANQNQKGAIVIDRIVAGTRHGIGRPGQRVVVGGRGVIGLIVVRGPRAGRQAEQQRHAGG